MASVIPAAIRVYSMAVAPDSSARNWRKIANIAPCVGHPGEASVNLSPLPSSTHSRRRSRSGSLAKFAAMRRASSLVSSLGAERHFFCRIKDLGRIATR